MAMECISLVGFFLSVLIVGISIGRFVEKVERLVRKLDEEEYAEKHKNDRR